MYNIYSNVICYLNILSLKMCQVHLLNNEKLALKTFIQEASNYNCALLNTLCTDDITNTCTS